MTFLQSQFSKALLTALLIGSVFTTFGAVAPAYAATSATCNATTAESIATTPINYMDYALGAYQYADIYETGYILHSNFIGCHYYYATSYEVWQNLTFSYFNSAVWLYDHANGDNYLASAPAPIENGFTPGTYHSGYTNTVYAPGGVDVKTGFRTCSSSSPSSCGSYTTYGYYGTYL